MASDWETTAECLLLIAKNLERKSAEARKEMTSGVDSMLHGSVVISLKRTAEAIRETVTKCEGCGRHYNPDWGSLCPNCTGAD